MTPSARETGARGEDRAIEFLEKNGFRVIERNYRTRLGEVDLIARDGDTVVFVEVKARGKTSLALPEESVDRMKMRRIIKASLDYLARNGLSDKAVRFDVVSIELGSLKASIIKDAFGADDV